MSEGKNLEWRAFCAGVLLGASITVIVAIAASFTWSRDHRPPAPPTGLTATIRGGGVCDNPPSTLLVLPDNMPPGTYRCGLTTLLPLREKGGMHFFCTPAPEGKKP